LRTGEENDKSSILWGPEIKGERALPTKCGGGGGCGKMGGWWGAILDHPLKIARILTEILV